MLSGSWLFFNWKAFPTLYNAKSMYVPQLLITRIIKMINIIKATILWNYPIHLIRLSKSDVWLIIDKCTIPRQCFSFKEFSKEFLIKFTTLYLLSSIIFCNQQLVLWWCCQGDPGTDGAAGEMGLPGFYGEGGEPGRKGESGIKILL